MKRVQDILLPFIHQSTAERWLLADDPEEISLILTEAADLYDSLSNIERLNLGEANLRNVILLVIENISLNPDPGLRLSAFRLLRCAAQQHSMAFSPVADKVFVCVKMTFQDISKAVKEAALKFAALWFSQTAFRTSASLICGVLESTTSFSEPMIVLSSVSVLQVLTEMRLAGDTIAGPWVSQSIDVFANYALDVVLRLQHCASAANLDLDMRSFRDGDSQKVVHQTTRATLTVLQAAIDLLTLACIALHAVEGFTSGVSFIPSSCRSNPSVVVFLNSDQLDMSALSKQMEQELLKRVRSFSFPSLMQESCFDVSMQLLEQLEDDGSAAPRAASSESESHGMERSVPLGSDDCQVSASFPHAKSRSRSTDMSPRVSLTEDAIATLVRSTTTPAFKELLAYDASNGSSSSQAVSPRAAPPLSGRNQSYERHSLRSLKQAKANSYSSGLVVAPGSPGLQSSGKFDVYLKEQSVVGPRASPLTPVRKTLAVPMVTHSPDLTRESKDKDDDSSVGMDRADSSSATLATLATFSSSLMHSLGSEAAPSPSPSASNDSYMRAASARVKRSRLKNLHHVPTHDSAPPPLDLERFVSGRDSPFLGQEFDSAYEYADQSGAVPTAQRQSLPSPNVRNREIRKMAPSSSSKPKPVIRQNSEGSAASNSYEYDSHFAHIAGAGAGAESVQVVMTPRSSAHATPITELAKSEVFEYIATADLLPLSHPSSEFAAALRGLETHEWPDIFHTLNNIRRAVLHHTSLVLQSSNLHMMMQFILKHVLNLRSSLAKNALLTVADCFLGLKRAMDVETNAVLPAVLKRCADSSNFLGESADQALLQMILHVSPSRSLAALLLGLDHKTAAIRAKASCMLAVLLRQHSGELALSRELDTIKGRLSRVLQDSSPEARSNGREIVRVLVNVLRVTKADLEGFVKVDLIEKALREAPSSGSGSNDLALRLLDGGETTLAQTPTRPTSHLPRISKYRTNSGQPNTMLSPQRNPSGTKSGGGNGYLDDDRSSTPSLSLFDDPHYAYDEDVEVLKILSSPQRTIGKDRVVHSATPLRAGQLPAPSRMQVANRSVASAHVGSRDSTAANSSYAAKRMMESDSELMQWPELQMRISTSKAFQEKKDAMTALTTLLCNHYPVLRDAGKLESSLDSILDRLEDGSIKVVQHAMDCLEQVQQRDPMVLQNSGPQVISPKLLSAVASSNKPISQRAIALLHRIYGGMSSTQAGAFLAHVIEHDKDKLRVSGLKVLAEMTSFAEDSDYLNSVIRRIIFPVVCKVFFTEASKAELRVACVEYFKVLQLRLRSTPGNIKIYTWVEGGKEQDDIKRITSSV